MLSGIGARFEATEATLISPPALAVAGAEAQAANTASWSPFQHRRSAIAPGSWLGRASTQAALVAGDCAGVAAAGIALTLAGLAGPGDWPLFLLLLACNVSMYGSASLYPGYRLDQSERLRRRVMSMLRIAALGCLGAVILAGSARTGLLVLEVTGLALAGQLVLLVVIRRALHAAGLWGEPLTIVASPERTADLVSYLRTNWTLGLRPEAGSRVALVAEDGITRERLLRLREDYAQVLLLADTPVMKVSGLQPRDIGGRLALGLDERATAWVPLPVTRVFDLLIAVPIALMTFPMMLFAALAIYAVDPGPVIYRQERVGLNGRRVRILKLRTMYLDAEARLDGLLAGNIALAAEWARSFKLRRDPRILPVVGKLLRSTSLDELPQLFNVIAGDMRLVGPRPFPDYHIAAMDFAFSEKRNRITPGLTGLWQVSARSEADVELQQQLDEYYIDNQTFWLDAQIFLSTPLAVFKRSGAY